MFKVVSARSGLAADEFATIADAIAYCQNFPNDLPFTVMQAVKVVALGTVTVTDPAQPAPAATKVIGG